MSGVNDMAKTCAFCEQTANDTAQFCGTCGRPFTNARPARKQPIDWTKEHGKFTRGQIGLVSAAFIGAVVVIMAAAHGCDTTLQETATAPGEARSPIAAKSDSAAKNTADLKSNDKNGPGSEPSPQTVSAQVQQPPPH
jgi:hypothetical protein